MKPDGSEARGDAPRAGRSAGGVPSIEGSERLFTTAEVDAELTRMAAEIDAHYAGEPFVALCMLQGGIIPAGLLLPRLETPLELDSVHITRYRKSTSGGDIDWLATPRTPLAGRRVLLIDDILDEGHSIVAVGDWCREAGASEVVVAVVVEKRHERKHPQARADFVGVAVPDRYVFGYGMDYHGYHRNAPGLFAVAD